MKHEPFFAASCVRPLPRQRRWATAPSAHVAPGDRSARSSASSRGNRGIILARYEGIDERVRIGLAAEEISIGDYVLNGGELAAMVIIEATARLVPGVVGDEQSVEADSFTNGWLDYPHYTRPPEIRGMHVPQVLLSGHHERIRRWRRREQIRRTLAHRPDLIEATGLSSDDRALAESAWRDEEPQ